MVTSPSCHGDQKKNEESVHVTLDSSKPNLAIALSKVDSKHFVDSEKQSAIKMTVPKTVAVQKIPSTFDASYPKQKSTMQPPAYPVNDGNSSVIIASAKHYDK